MLFWKRDQFSNDTSQEIISIFTSIQFKEMKTKNILLMLSASIIMTSLVLTSYGQYEKNEPWTIDQLMQPGELAKIITDKKAKQPIILSIGPGAVIKGSIDIGAAHEEESFKKLKEQLSNYSKDAAIVLYCGCCPFERCPNIRPAFQLLNEMKFTNAKLLNLEHNIKTDWMNKGYPVQD